MVGSGNRGGDYHSFGANSGLTFMNDIETIRDQLLARVKNSENPNEVFKDVGLKRLYERLRTLNREEKAAFGQAVNTLKAELSKAVKARETELSRQNVSSLDVTAPADINMNRPGLLPAETGSRHPLMRELQTVIDIFVRMGFDAIESRQIDDDFHMFGALNFPANHPARDSYDTFRTADGYIPPAHTSTMQHRILLDGRGRLEAGEAIAAISYGRVFRNEDVDATHSHTFYQCEGVYVSKDASLAQMLGLLRGFLETYYRQSLRIKTQPSYFPFVEPGLEFAIEKPAQIGGKSGDWLEMFGCGMIHPNVLSLAGIDPTRYRGFAWGGGIDRLVMLKYGIEDLRHFQSGKLQFLREFA